MKNIVLSAFLFLGVCQLLHGQGINFEPDKQDTSRSVLGLKVQIPQFTGSESIATFSGLYTLSFQAYLGNDWNLNAEIPFIIADSEFETDNGSANFFISFRKWLNESRTTAATAGVYLPTLGSDNLFRSSVGLYSNIARLPQFIESAWTLYGNYGYNSRADRREIFGVYAGPDVVIPTRDGDVELLAHLGMKGGYTFDIFSAWLELNGVYIFTESELFNNSKLDGQLVFAGQFNLKGVRLGGFYTLYFNQFITEQASGVYGLKVEFDL